MKVIQTSRRESLGLEAIHECLTSLLVDVPKERVCSSGTQIANNCLANTMCTSGEYHHFALRIAKRTRDWFEFGRGREKHTVGDDCGNSEDTGSMTISLCHCCACIPM